MISYDKKRKLDRTAYVSDAKYIVIATEDEKKEKQYFEMIKNDCKNPRVCVEVLETTDGKSAPSHVLERAIRKRKDIKFETDKDEFWLVMDVDRWGKNLLESIAEAHQRNIEVAVSNPCFEYWLFLHHSEAIGDNPDCEEIKEKLKNIIGPFISKHNDLDVSKFSGRVAEAVRRAKESDPDTNSPPLNRLGTHVYKIVERCMDAGR